MLLRLKRLALAAFLACVPLCAYAQNKPISQLPPGGTLLPTDLLGIVRGQNDYKVTDAGIRYVPYGGTGLGTLTAHGVLVGNGANPITQVTPGAAGTLFVGEGSSSDPAFTATPILGVAGTTRGTLSLAGDTSGTVTIQPADAAGTWTLTLPTTAGSNGYVLSTDGSGVTSWAPGGGGGCTSGCVSSLTGDVTTTGSGAAAATVVKINGVAVPANPPVNSVLYASATNTAMWTSLSPMLAVYNGALSPSVIPPRTVSGNTYQLQAPGDYGAYILLTGGASITLPAAGADGWTDGVQFGFAVPAGDPTANFTSAGGNINGSSSLAITGGATGNYCWFTTDNSNWFTQCGPITPGASSVSAPTPTTLGGVLSYAGASHQFLTGIGIDGTPTHAQPAASDISGLATVATSGSVSDLSGTLPIVRGGTGQTTASAALQGLYPFPKYHAALALTRQGISNTKICLVGDSTTQGANSTSGLNYPNLLAIALQNSYGLPTSYWNFFGYSTVGGGIGAIPGLTIGSSWTQDTTDFSLGGLVYTATTGTNSLSLNPQTVSSVQQPVDTFVVYYRIASGNGVLYEDVDGSNSTTTSTSNATTSVGILNVSTTLGTHTLNLKWSSGGKVQVIGVEAYNSTSPSVIVDNLGASGSTAYQQYGSTSDPTNGGNSAIWAAIGCSLVVDNLGINDEARGITQANYISAMSALLTAQQGSSDIAVMTHVPSNPSGGGASMSVQTSFMAALRTLAQSFNAPVIDNFNRWVSYAYSLPFGVYSDGFVHPNSIGYGEIATATAKAIADYPAIGSDNFPLNSRIYVSPSTGNMGIMQPNVATSLNVPTSAFQVGTSGTNDSPLVSFGQSNSGGIVDNLSLVNSASAVVGNEVDMDFHPGGNFSVPTATLKTALTSTDGTSDFSITTYGSSGGTKDRLHIQGGTGYVGIGTSSPQAGVDDDVGKMLVRGGSSPTTSSCGTGAVAAGADSSFTLMMGSTATTSCVVNFGSTWLTAPKVCVLEPTNSTAAAVGTTGAYVSAISTTQLTIAGTTLANASYGVHCY
jgi:lysophospholipase L1-like esterase